MSNEQEFDMTLEPYRDMARAVTLGRVHLLCRLGDEIEQAFQRIAMGRERKAADLFGFGDNVPGEEWKKQHDAQSKIREKAYTEVQALIERALTISRDLMSTDPGLIADVT